jgi:DNA-binding NtrC family response regulator
MGGERDNPASFESATKEFQSQLIRKALAACNESRDAAARMLGMSRSSFFRYLAILDKQSSGLHKKV